MMTTTWVWLLVGWLDCHSAKLKRWYNGREWLTTGKGNDNNARTAFVWFVHEKKWHDVRFEFELIVWAVFSNEKFVWHSAPFSELARFLFPFQTDGRWFSKFRWFRLWIRHMAECVYASMRRNARRQRDLFPIVAPKRLCSRSRYKRPNDDKSADWSKNNFTSFTLLVNNYLSTLACCCHCRCHRYLAEKKIERKKIK